MQKFEFFSLSVSSLYSSSFAGDKEHKITYFCRNISFCHLQIEVIPKSAISVEFHWCWNSFFQKKTVQFFHLGLIGKLPTCEKQIAGKIINFLPCIRFLIARKFQKVPSVLEIFNFQTRISSELLAWFLPKSSQWTILNMRRPMQLKNHRLNSWRSNVDCPKSPKKAIYNDLSE